jgi:PAS domain S-box-containing protein
MPLATATSHLKHEDRSPRTPTGKLDTSVATERSTANPYAVFENAPIGIHVLDANGVITWANRTELKMLGYRAEEYVGHPIAEFHLDHDVIAEMLDELRRDQVLTGREVRLRHKDGSIRIVVIDANVLWQDGEFVHARCFTRDVTGRKLSERLVRVQFDELENIYRTAPIGLALIDEEFRFTRINERLAEINGIPAAQHLGHTIRELLPDLADQAEAVFRRVFATGEPILNVEFGGQTRAQPGMNRVWNESWYPIKDAAGETIAINVVVEEITERKQTEEALAHLAAIVASSTDAIISKTLTGIVTSWNRSAERIFGYTAEEMIGQPILRLIPIDRHDEEDHILARLRRGEQVGHFETVRLTKSGRPIEVELSISPVTDRAGKIIGASKIVRDVTERKRAEALLRDHARQLSLITDTAPVFIAYCDVDSRYKFVNAAYADRFGLKPQDCVGERIADVVGDDAYESLREYIDAVLRGERIEFDTAVPYAALGERFMHCSYAPEFDVTGCVVGFVAAISDITERKRVEEALRTSEEKLKEADRRKDEFLAMLAHELRNPLAPIANAVHLLRQNRAENPVQEQARAIIERQSARLARLVDDLLEVSRITTGRIRLHMERVVIGGIVQRAVETVRPLIEQHRHALSLSLPTEPIWLYADAARLEQVVVNLLTNAVKYTDDDGRIELEVRCEGNDVVLSVRDNGIGIDPELLPRVFDLFTQAERSLDRAHGGLGIGLSLVQRLVSMHGGTVVANSTLGQGSEFMVRVPAAVAPVAPAEANAASNDVATVHPLRILVVDDNVDAARSMAMLLEVSGHVVWLAHDGVAAVAAAAEYRPHVLFLDIGLPKLDGYRVAECLRSNAATRDIVLVAITGYGQAADREQARAAGFDHHLVKPVDFPSVEEILAQISKQFPTQQ